MNIYKKTFIKTLKITAIFVDGVSYAGNSWDEYTLDDLINSIDENAQFYLKECLYATGHEEGVVFAYEMTNTSRRIVLYAE